MIDFKTALQNKKRERKAAEVTAYFEQLKSQKSASLKEMTKLSMMIYDRDKNPNEIFDLEMAAVQRGILQGMQIMEQILKGIDLRNDLKNDFQRGDFVWVNGEVTFIPKEDGKFTIYKP